MHGSSSICLQQQHYGWLLELQSLSCGAGSSFPTASSNSCSCSSDLTTSFMSGRSLGSTDRHRNASLTARNAPRIEYWPWRRESKIWRIFRLLVRCERAHSTKLCSPEGRFLSTALRPHSISRRTTPKLYTSLFLVKCPFEQENESEIRQGWWWLTEYYKQVNFKIEQILQLTNTCGHILRSSITKCAHNSRGDVAFISWGAIPGQSEIRKFRTIVLLFTVQKNVKFSPKERLKLSRKRK